ncbi:MAG: hypothetical protein H7322_16360 [Ramlibacter sp.]|nr:hypothetical protein [Ramlibacter sp.]
MSFRLLRPLASAAVLAAALLLASCGGGGDAASPAPLFPASSSLANMCTLEGQQKFVRSFMDETYLWYDEIPAVNAADYSTVPAYFNALLVKTPDASGQPRDRFSAVLTSAGANALQIAPDGAVLRDGVPGNLLAATNKSVPLTRIVNSPNGRKVGYILFNDHNQGAQDELIAAFDALRNGGVNDLVLDMRYNTGGFLYVAQTAASMVTGPQSDGRVFEQLRFSARRRAETAASTYLFSSRVQTAETVYPRGTPLPQLNLPRLYVLASGQTCSASESIVNSLRGIDVDVILVGSATCGKPYGFHRQDNCGLAFFAIEFQGYNAKNFGDYTGGFKATCPVADTFSSVLGSTAEPLLAGALQHIDTGSCPAASATSPGIPLTQRLLLDGRLLR